MTYHSKQRLSGQAPDVSVAALHSLTRSDVATARAALEDLGWPWSFETAKDYDGDLIIMISQQDDRDPVFVLHGSRNGIRLGRVINDGWDYLGCYTCVENAIRDIAAACTDICVAVR
jgi:hypothetical protein